MPVRFELGHAVPPALGRSQLLSFASHALVGSVLIAMPALTPVALPRVNVPRLRPAAPTVATVVVSAPRTARTEAGSASVVPSAPNAAESDGHRPPRPIPVDALAAWAGRLLESEDVGAAGPEWGAPSGGFSSAGIPGGLVAASSSAAGGGATGVPREIGGDLRRPVLLSGPPPIYPDMARRVHLEGEVLIECVIDVHGSVRGAHVVSGPALLRSAALDAVSRWRYAPTLLNGQPVAVRLAVSVRFQLR